MSNNTRLSALSFSACKPYITVRAKLLIHSITLVQWVEFKVQKEPEGLRDAAEPKRHVTARGVFES